MRKGEDEGCILGIARVFYHSWSALVNIYISFLG